MSDKQHDSADKNSRSWREAAEMLFVLALLAALVGGGLYLTMVGP